MSHRAEYAPLLPVFARVYGIRHWEIDELTVPEILRLIDDLNTQAELANPESDTNKLRAKHKKQAHDAAQALLGR